MGKRRVYGKHLFLVASHMCLISTCVSYVYHMLCIVCGMECVWGQNDHDDYRLSFALPESYISITRDKGIGLCVCVCVCVWEREVLAFLLQNINWPALALRWLAFCSFLYVPWIKKSKSGQILCFSRDKSVIFLIVLRLWVFSFTVAVTQRQSQMQPQVEQVRVCNCEDSQQ